MTRVTVTFPPGSGISDVYCQKLSIGWNVFCGEDRLNQFPILTLENAADYLMAYYEVPELRIDIDGTAS